MDYLQPRKTLMFRTFRSNGEILCDVTFVFKEANRSLLDEGRIEVIMKFKDLNSMHDYQERRYVENWCKDGDYYSMRVIDFTIDPALHRQGLGTFIWSIIFRELPQDVSSNIRLTGAMTCIDATVPQTDDTGRLVTKWNKGDWQPGVVRIDNIGNRTRFWSRVVGPSPAGEPALVCSDESGEGKFRGWLRDPYCMTAKRILYSPLNEV